MLDDDLIEWLAKGLAKPGKSQSGLARALGIAPAGVNRALKRERQIKAREIPTIATYIGEPPPAGLPELTIDDRAPVLTRYGGLIEAGSYREVDQFVQLARVEIFEPRDSAFPDARLLTFDVGGDSMNALKPRPILPGDRVVAIDFDDLRGRVPLKNDMVVVVEQSRDGGHLIERSLKQVEIRERENWFCPRSTNPAHKPIVVPRDPMADDGRTVRILALVRRVSNDLPV